MGRQVNEMKFNLLEIDLSSGEKKIVDLTDDVRQYVGGRGLGAKFLWDQVPEGTDPLSPQNILFFGIGPITGFLGSVTNVSALSPLTLLRGQSNMNGHFGAELIYAGYNAGLLLRGKADRPVYVYIKNDDVEIREGYVPSRDDILPDRFFEETIYNKYGEPKTLSREKFLETRKKTYLVFGLNEDGIPTKKTLKELGMEFVVPTLEKKLGKKLK
jgi:aldehyde:ferredoxin oxidoreductase